MSFEYIDYYIARKFVPAIVNDDRAGLDAMDEMALDAFLQKVYAKYPDATLTVSDHAGDNFRGCSATGPLADCVRLTVVTRLED